ncbi:hypothetical protein [Mucilaginibacter psychrotolerans]|nr:hypothetical protein [Mucilaginibacter psychrotolerans]
MNEAPSLPPHLWDGTGAEPLCIPFMLATQPSVKTDGNEVG